MWYPSVFDLITSLGGAPTSGESDLSVLAALTREDDVFHAWGGGIFSPPCISVYGSNIHTNTRFAKHRFRPCRECNPIVGRIIRGDV
jgi:hypothetical protein